MFAWFLFYLFTTVWADDDFVSLQPRILYGKDVRIEDYPFYAGLIDCGAAIISDVWILTAAHCVADVDMGRQNYVWVGGETFFNSIQIQYNKVIVHEEFRNDRGLFNDVALIKLSTPLKFSAKVRQIKLPYSGAPSTKFVFVGRGNDEDKLLKITKVDLVRLTPEKCISMIPKGSLDYVGKENVEFLKKTNICAKREADMPTICQGDSGGPLVSGDTIVGLASYIGTGRCEDMRLGFYVNLPYYLPWIRKHTGL